MSRRKNQIFNLAFLDLITGALGAVIFLFIITPKGGSSAPNINQAVMYLDTAEMKIFGELHDSLRGKEIGDTLFTVLVDYKHFPKPEKRKAPEKLVDFNQPKPSPKVSEQKKKTETPVVKVSDSKTTSIGTESKQSFKGDAPSVPCKVSFEVSWASKEDNVDFFVCKGGSCVYGGRKRDRSIGQWDSGKSRNRLFSNDLRTTQEAVRQFDQLIPGEYALYAQFKESKRNAKSVKLNGLIYTKGKSNQQRGESFTSIIPLGKKRVLIGRVILNEDGSYQFK